MNYFCAKAEFAHETAQLAMKYPLLNIFQLCISTILSVMNSKLDDHDNSCNNMSFRLLLSFTTPWTGVRFTIQTETAPSILLLGSKNIQHLT